ncbi:Ig-like domain-containing protein [Termitidicoccus mucosus]|uniref:Uncharacterized protein n=2 Tax=Termitidicoccus mucosus TaxID=1184151 RepID=A0A178IPT0_9BACT|nr:hypothetical protein AW736_01925 [Opitutaceae bacterium TSB47]
MLFSLCGGSVVHAAEPLCARVTIKLSQRLTLERQAFEGTLAISNGLAQPIEDFAVTLWFRNADGEAVAYATPGDEPEGALFFVRLKDDSWNPSTDGTIPADHTREAVYLMIPAPGAAGEQPDGLRYMVGATLSYRIGTSVRHVEMQPEEIQVRPMPDLLLQYFLPGDMVGDHPMTTEPEASEPAVFGLRVVNQSAWATAQNVKVESNQPEIVSNDLGLLIDFRITGCQVNGKDFSSSLLADLGNIGPHGSAMAYWSLVSSLAGRFTRVHGTVTHADKLGGALTSLVQGDDPMVRRLVGRVRVDLPGRDALDDYLAVESFTADTGTARVFESDNAVLSTDVITLRAGDSRLSYTLNGDAVMVAADEVAGTLFYAKIPLEASTWATAKVTRSDGKRLLPQNAWISKTYQPAGGWQLHLNLFDTQKQETHRYNAVLSGAAPSENTPPVLQFMPDTNALTIEAGRLLTLQVTAMDADGDAVRITAPELPAGASYTPASDSSGTLNWRPLAGQEGPYSLRFMASDGLASVFRAIGIQVKEASSLIWDWNAWVGRNWPGVIDPAIIGPEVDPDHDGLTNLLEYAMDTDPRSGVLTVQPQPEILIRDDQPHLALRYRLRSDDPSLRIRVEVTDDFFTWHPAAGAAEKAVSDLPGLTGMTDEWLWVEERPVEGNTGARALRLIVTREDSEE